MAALDGVIPAIIGAANAASADDYEIERSLRFNSADTAHLSRTMGTFTDINVGTISFWLKRSALGAGVIAAGWGGSTSYSGSVQFNSTDNALQVGIGGAAAYLFKTNAFLRDVSAWYHVVVNWDRSASAADKVKVWINGVAQTSSDTGYQSWTSGDCQIWASNSGNRIGRGDADRYDNLLNGFLAEYHYVDGQALDESSFGAFDNNNNWNPKEYAGTYGNEGFYLNFSDNSSNAALGTDSSGNSNTWTVNNITATGLDYVQSTTGTLYSGSWDQAFNGSTSTPAPYVYNTTASVSWDINISGVFEIYTSLPGTYAGNPTVYTLSNGATYSKSTTSAEWINLGSQTNVTSLSVNAPDPGAYIFAIRVDGTILVSTEPYDTDSLIDSPTDYTADSGNNGGNYATFNSLYYRADTTFSNGNLQIAAAAYYRSGIATIPLNNGKWYYEAEIITDSDNGYSMVGVTTVPNAETYPGAATGEDGFGWYSADGALYPSGGTYSSWTVGDIVSVAYDSTTRYTWIAKNGVWQNSGDPAAGTGSVFTIGGTNTPYFSTATGINGVITANFGQRPFTHTPPTGYKALCTTNLDDPTIAEGSTAMDAKLYSGNGSSQTITGLGFSPDLVWIKSRSNALNHRLVDQVQGNTSTLASNLDTAAVDASSDFTGFTSDGFSLTNTASFELNNGSATYVAWAWDAGSSTESNTDGTITSQVRANQSTGCSVVSYTSTDVAGATVGHGLNAVMDFAIFKNRDRAQNWLVYHKSLDITSGEAINLNQTNAAYASAAQFNSTLATSSVFTLGSGGNASNAAGDDIIAYCFAPVEGYSAFGSYTGNGLTDGTFVFTGFRPAFVLLKCSSNGSTSWTIQDNKRLGYNPDQDLLFPDTTDSENSTSYMDFVSNGFKLRINSNFSNASGYTYIYAAFAEHPFKTARAR